MGKTSRGRPRKPDAEKVKPAFMLNLTDAEFELVRQAADGKVSAWAREVVLRAARRKAKQA